MEHARKLTFPKGTPENFIKEVGSKIDSWHIVTKVTIEGLEIGWDQVSFFGYGAEGLSAFVEGLMLGFNQAAKNPITITIANPGMEPYNY